MFQRILLPLDGSSRAEQALPIAACIARMSHGTVMLLKTIDYPLELEVHSLEHPLHPALAHDQDVGRAQEYLSHVAASESLVGIPVHTDALTGAPAQTILLVVQMQHVDLIVMCSRGATGLPRWPMGSVAQKVTRHSPVPVLVIHEENSALQVNDLQPLRALVALDGSSLAEAALVPAIHLVALLSPPSHQGIVHLLRVVKPPLEEKRNRLEDLKRHGDHRQEAEAYLRTVRETLSSGRTTPLGVQIISSVVEDHDVAATLLAIAEASRPVAEFPPTKYDLLVIATHGRGGIQRWMVGSITERLLSTARLPMLIVRPSEQG